MKEVISKLQNNKSSGIDGIIGCWFKNLKFYINDLVKLVNSILNNEIDEFLQDHCDSNKIITNEQAGDRKEVWGCLEQLIINETILDQVKENRRSLITIWLDYKKALDSVPHEWLFTALKLTKVPKKIIEAIRTLSKQWSTNLIINGK